MLSGFIEIERERKLLVLIKKGQDRAIRIYGTLGPPAHPPIYAPLAGLRSTHRYPRHTKDRAETLSGRVLPGIRFL